MINEEDLNELKVAKNLLENPGLAIKITNFIGEPIEKGIEKLPKNWKNKIGDITQKSLLKASEAAAFTMKKETGKKSSNLFHKIVVAASGAGGGFFGLPGLAIELPTSTTIMLRSIMDIARENGENIENIETKLACLEVFALGGKSDNDDEAESSYYAIKTLLAKSVTDAAKFIAEKGLIEESAPALVKLVSKIAERFGIQVGEKAAGQSIPIIGAAAGAIINTLFMDHFQDMAKGHFTVRKLEKKYNPETIKIAYEKI